MKAPHRCRCEDGVVVTCLCDNPNDHDEKDFILDQGEVYTEGDGE